MTRMPAAAAASTPLGASSMAKQSLGSAPRLWAAARKQSGAGLPLVTWHGDGTSVCQPRLLAGSKPHSYTEGAGLQMAPCCRSESLCTAGRPQKRQGVILVAWAHNSASQLVIATLMHMPTGRAQNFDHSSPQL